MGAVLVIIRKTIFGIQFRSCTCICVSHELYYTSCWAGPLEQNKRKDISAGLIVMQNWLFTHLLWFKEDRVN